MKKLVSLTMLAFMAVTAFCQTATLEQAINESLTLLNEAKTIEDVQSAVNRFERIALAEPARWEPVYHYAYAQIMQSFWEKNAEVKDGLLDKAGISISKALELNGDKSELYTLQGLLYQGRIMVDFNRGMTYSQQAADKLGTALYENPENPRAVYLLGLNIRHTPEGFGGGCANALPRFLEAKALFEKENGKTGLMPRWGAESNLEAIKACNGEK